MISILFFLLFSPINTYKIDLKIWKSAQNFDGFGAVSGGGATSKLLFTYFPEEDERRKVLEIMFNKNDGLQILKVEMGGDDQSTEGSESSHESEKGEFSENNYEFQLIHEVLQVNPKIPICVLPWAFPGWLGKNNPYENWTTTAEYVVEWIRIGREKWNFETFCVGIWNERDFQEGYVRELRRILNFNKFNKTFIVAGEGYKMDQNYKRLLDKDFINDYDILGVHYPGGKIPQIVQQSGKILWASEDYSTNNRGTGLGCMARTMNWNYVDGNITGMLAWNLVSAFYPQLPWWRCGLAMLDEEKFETEDALHVLKYVAAHVKRGWKILPHGRGSGKFQEGGTYVTYTDGKDFTIFMETMSFNASLCEYNSPAPYHVKTAQKIRFEFSQLPGFSNFPGFNISLNFKPSQFLPFTFPNTIEFSLPIDSFGILTTLPVTVPQRITVPTPQLSPNYKEDFSNYSYDDEPRFWMPQKGSWVVRDGRAVQKTIRPPISWCTGTLKTPYAVMAYPGKQNGIRGDVRIPKGSKARSVILGIRSNCGGCDIETTNCRGIFVEVDFSKIHIFSDFIHRTTIAEFILETPVKFGKFYKFSIFLKNYQLFVKFGGDMVMKLVKIPGEILEKTKNDTLFVMGTGNFGISEWDNFSINF